MAGSMNSHVASAIGHELPEHHDIVCGKLRRKRGKKSKSQPRHSWSSAIGSPLATSFCPLQQRSLSATMMFRRFRKWMLNCCNLDSELGGFGRSGCDLLGFGCARETEQLLHRKFGRCSTRRSINRQGPTGMPKSYEHL